MEKIYLSLKNSGVLNITIGAITLITGTLLIISGNKLLKNRSTFLF